MPQAFASRPVAPPGFTLDAGAPLVFVIQGTSVLVRESADGQAQLPTVAEARAAGYSLETAHYLGELGERAALTLELEKDAPLPEGFKALSLRALWGKLDEDVHALAGRAFQIVDWDRTHRFCGRCSTPTELDPKERARRCPKCELSVYPRVAPAVIVLIRKGKQALLARGKRFPMPMYSTLAGFVEAGESLEETVVREMREEAGVEVKNLRYFGSQPWPFPHSLMIGFTAEWAGGEIKIEEAELVDAGWYSVDNLPMLPHPMSIASKLINAWIEEQRST